MKKEESILESIQKYTAESKRAAILLEFNNNNFLSISEADIETRKKEVSSDMKIKISKLTKIKTQLSQNNNTWLATYEEAAKRCNPIGLTMKSWTSVDFDRFDQLYKKAFAYLESMKRGALNIKDISQMKEWLKVNIRENGIYKKMFSIVYGKDKPDKTVFIDSDQKHKVTKNDIQQSIKILKNVDTYMKTTLDTLKYQQKLMDATLHTNVDPLQKNGALNGDLDDYYNTVKLNIVSLYKILVTRMYNDKIHYYRLEQLRARLVIKKAAKYNAKHFKESVEESEEIEDMFDHTILDKIFDEV